MALKRRPDPYVLPSFSLTGDLLSFIRCGLQYRYHKVGQLPSTNPIQLWFGQFIHGVMEEAYRRYDEGRDSGTPGLPPWPDSLTDEIIELIMKRLAAQNLFPRSARLEALGKERAKTAINQLGPELLPLIHQAEIRLRGTQPLPAAAIPARYRIRQADRYEVMGVIDVLSHVELKDPQFSDNRLVEILDEGLTGYLPDQFEVIIDYKGMRRPPSKHTSGPDYWAAYAWQTRVYAHLRRRQPDSLPVAAGLLLYLNELHPTSGDIKKLKAEIAAGTTDVVPDPGSIAERLINAWNPGDPVPALPLKFRLRRTVRIVDVSDAEVQAALTSFDTVVAQIETCHGKEAIHGDIVGQWDKNPSDPGTCDVCDANTICPSFAGASTPQLPFERV